MSMRRFTAGAFALAVLAGGCAQTDSPTTPKARPDVQAPVAAPKGPESLQKVPSSSINLTVAVGCADEYPLKCEEITAQTRYVAMFTMTPAAVRALRNVRTPADISFISSAAAPSPSDTVPAGPGPGLFRAYRKGSGAVAVASLLNAERFVMPSDTVPAGPSKSFLFFRSEGAPAAMLFLSVQQLARDGVLSRSPQPDGTPMSILLSDHGRYTYQINMVLPPSDTVPAGPGK